MDGSGSLVSVSGLHPPRVWEERRPPGTSPVSSSRARVLVLPCLGRGLRGVRGWAGEEAGREPAYVSTASAHWRWVPSETLMPSLFFLFHLWPFASPIDLNFYS